MRNIGGEKPGSNSMPSQTETTVDTTGTTQPAQARMRSGQRGEIVVHPDGRRTRNGLELDREKEEDSESSEEELLPSSEVEIVNRSNPEVTQAKASRAEKTKEEQSVINYAWLETAINAGDVAAVKQFIVQHPGLLEQATKSGSFPLHQAVACDQIVIAEILIDAMDSDINQGPHGLSALMFAVQEGHKEMVELLIGKGANINHEGPDKNTALMLATQNNYIEIVGLLIRNEANIDLADNDNYTALMFAAANGHKEIAKLLIDAGAIIDLADNDNYTALMFTAENGHAEIAKLLISKGANINHVGKSKRTALMIATQNNYIEMVELLIKNEAKIDLADDRNQTPLMMAAQKGYTKIAQLLIDAGANIDLTVNWNWTALMFAAENGHTEIAKLLVDARANIDLAVIRWTALIAASQNGHTEIAKLLINKGANINHVGPNHRTALMMSTRNNHIEMVGLLIKNEAKIDLADDRNLTTLMIAAQNGHIKIAKMLIDARANIDLADNSSWTALMFAAANGYKEIVELLLAKLKSLDPDFFQRADNNLPADSSVPPRDYSLRQSLMKAVEAGHHEILRLLLKAGAKPDPGNDQDEWPLHVAIQKRHPLVVKTLVELGANLAQADKNNKTALQLALDMSPPNSLLIDILLDSAATAANAQGKVKDVITFDDLTVAAISMLQVQQAGIADESAWRVFANSLCAVYGLRYIVAQSLTATLRQLSAVYLPTNPNEPAPTAAQWKRVFLQSVLSAQILNDLSRQDDSTLNKLYAKSARYPDTVTLLVHAAGAQAQLLIDSAMAQSDTQLQTFRQFIQNLTPGSTAAQIATFVTNEAGWHSLLAELLAESWQNLAVINRTAAGLYAAVAAALDAPAFAEKIDNLASDEVRLLVMRELTMFRELIQD